MTTQPRPRQLAGTTYEMTCGCGQLFVTCNDQDGRLFEVFLRLGKSGGCASAVNEGAALLASNALRSGTAPTTIIKSLSGISCHTSRPGLPSCLAAAAEAIQSHVGDAK